IEVDVSWRNFDLSLAKHRESFQFDAQRSDVDWAGLTQRDPYSLEPVTTEAELVGRADILAELVARAQAPSIGSSYLFGQKRVGKTSIVRTVKSHLSKLRLADYLVIYLEAGDYITGDAKTTIDTLGHTLCDAIRSSDDRF